MLSEQGNLIVSPRAPDFKLLASGGMELSVCYNWSCKSVKRIQFSKSDLEGVRRSMDICKADHLHERLQRVRIGVWRMEVLAQQRIPVIANDLEVNDLDAELEGRMDCIDNASNTTNYLSTLSVLGMLPGWTVGKPQARDMLTKDVHWTAILTDEGSSERWAVDSWFRPNGNLPFVSPVADWVLSRKPWEAPLDRENHYPRRVERLCDSASRRLGP